MDNTLFPLRDELDDEAGREDSGRDSSVPLADRLRPRKLEEVEGQEHLLGKGRFLRTTIASDEIPSLIFWGPPGTGKTTLARIIARETRSHFVSLSAVLAGVKDVKKVVEAARYQRKVRGRHTILFVDEIHRFNKAQQDAFLPHVENGTLVLIGATTENPSFSVIAPLLSRSRVLVLQPLTEEQIVRLLERALSDREHGLGSWNLQLEEGVLEQLAVFANGDARAALNTLEVASQLARNSAPKRPVLSRACLEEAMQKRTLLYDRAGEEHFNIISALHKSLRNSDADAALYWLARMLEAGEDPLYVARRLVRFASEDVGMADPKALGYAVDAWQAVHFIGMPEGKLALAQLAVYLAQAPKSNALYEAYQGLEEAVKETRNEPVPLHLRNAPTPLMKELGYGEGYRYAHHEPERVADMECLPEGLRGQHFYRPRNEGFEEEVRRRLEEIAAARRRSKAHGVRD